MCQALKLVTLVKQEEEATLAIPKSEELNHLKLARTMHFRALWAQIWPTHRAPSRKPTWLLKKSFWTLSRVKACRILSYHQIRTHQCTPQVARQTTILPPPTPTTMVIRPTMVQSIVHQPTEMANKTTITIARQPHKLKFPPWTSTAFYCTTVPPCLSKPSNLASVWHTWIWSWSRSKTWRRFCKWRHCFCCCRHCSSWDSVNLHSQSYSC